MLGDKENHNNFSQKYRRPAMFLALLLALWIGYQLAETERTQLKAQIALLNGNVAQLNAENHVITQQVNELSARQSVCDSQLTLTQEAKHEERQTLAACEEQVAFYQHVMAPEVSQRLLSVDLMQAGWSDTQPNTIEIELVLLQPRTQKATISGKLTLELIIEGGDATIPLASIDYRFKFFQQVKEKFAIPADAVPVALRLSSSVTQYKRVREEFTQEIPWPTIGLKVQEAE